MTRPLAALALSASLALSACGATASGPTAAPPATTASPATTPPVASSSPASSSTVPGALRFSAMTLDGARFEGASLAGKPVVFWFWAPWCPKCRADAPAVTEVAGKHPGVTFVGVAGLDTEAAMKEFVTSTGTAGLVHLSDEAGAVWTKLGVTQQSVYVFMKPDGSTEKVGGPLGADGLAARVATLAG